MYRVTSNRLFRTEALQETAGTSPPRASISNLINVAEWRGRHGRRYDKARDLEGLIEAAAEAVAVVAERIGTRLPSLPQVRRRILRPLANLLPKPYSDCSETIHRVQAECLVAAASRCTDEISEAMEGCLAANERDILCELLSRKAALASNRNLPTEREELDIEVTVALAAERSFPAINDDARITRISSAFQEATGREVPSDSELAALTGLLAADLVTEPKVFVQNVERLAPPNYDRLRELLRATQG